MRYSIFIVLSFSFSIQSLAQDSTIIEITCEERDIYDAPEIDPMFPGGQDSLLIFFMKNIVPPPTCACGSWLIYVEFIVNTDRSLSNIKIIKGSGITLLDKEALRVVQSMPNWIPAQDNGKVVKSRYIVPISIKTI